MKFPNAKMIPIDKLIPYDRNAKKHPDEQVNALASMFLEFGFDQAIVVDKNYVIVKGHGRRLAAIKAGFKEVPVIVRDDLTAAKVRASRIADNRIAQTDWDNEALASELKILEQEAEELLQLTGFDQGELDELLKEPRSNPGDGNEDDIPDVPQNVRNVQRGQIWQLGDHRMMCGDSTSKDDVERLMGGEKAEMMFTDPPYGVEYDESWRGQASPDSYFGGSIKGQLKNDDVADWTPAFLLADVNFAYVWHSAFFEHVVRQSLVNAGFEIRQQIIWKKPFGIMSRQNYNWQHESAWYVSKKGKSVFWADDNTQTTVWDVENPNHVMSKKGEGDVKTDHPTMKPVRLAEIAINNHKCKSVLDLFLGSGSTLIACEKTNRKCFGCEIDPHYCSVIIERWEKYTGRKAELVNA